jgi:hypothetical protein
MGRVGGAQGRGELQRILLDQRQAEHDEVERDGHRKFHRLGAGTGAAGDDAVARQRLLDGLGAEVPVIDHQCSRTGDRWWRHALVGQPKRPGGLAARAPFVEQPLEPDQTAHPGHQRLVLDRFGQEVIGPRLQSPQSLGGFAERGDHYHGNVQRRRVILQPAATLEPVHPRHHDVEQDEIRLPLMRHAERLEPILGTGDLKVLGRKLGFQQAGVGRHIVDDQDPGGHRWRVRPHCTRVASMATENSGSV